jgi:hypothetical protein
MSFLGSRSDRINTKHTQKEGANDRSDFSIQSMQIMMTFAQTLSSYICLWFDLLVHVNEELALRHYQCDTEDTGNSTNPGKLADYSVF